MFFFYCRKKRKRQDYFQSSNIKRKHFSDLTNVKAIVSYNGKFLLGNIDRHGLHFHISNDCLIKSYTLDNS
jgi:hypothetical protein